MSTIGIYWITTTINQYYWSLLSLTVNLSYPLSFIIHYWTLSTIINFYGHLFIMIIAHDCMIHQHSPFAPSRRMRNTFSSTKAMTNITSNQGHPGRRKMRTSWAFGAFGRLKFSPASMAGSRLVRIWRLFVEIVIFYDSLSLSSSWTWKIMKSWWNTD